ncbi:MAG: arylsulfatase [Candidatus Pacebacteria bacterium]|nr:arylsulfatase [Candidatus Paceibacterota bacterium]
MKKTNLVMIVADDMGFSDAGCYGGEISTPNLDALGRNGVRFTQHYSAGRCWPSRACILTGQYYQQVPNHPDKGPLPDWGRTIPHYLKPLGYRCYHTGKWHVNQVPTIIRHGGFDRSYYIRDYDRNFAVRNHQLDDRPLPPADQESGYYSSTAIAQYGLDFLDEHERQHEDDPFFLYVGFIAPHFPLHAPREDIDVYRGRYDEGWDRLREERMRRLYTEGILSCELSPRQPDVKPEWNVTPEQLEELIGPGEAPYACAWDDLTAEQKRFQARKMEVHAAMIHRMDREIGRLIDKLKAMGEYENTVIMFVSDNGASAEQIIRGDGHDKSAVPGTEESYLCLGPGWSTNCNTPFRYHKSWVHEGGVASPLIVHWPAGISTPGELRKTPGHFVDLLPTMLEIAGTEAMPDWRGADTPPLAGVSLAPAFNGDRDIPRDFIFFSHIGHRAIRVDDWKLVSVKDGPWELYNLETDRSELHDLAAQHPEKVAELEALWQKTAMEYQAQSGEPRIG